MALQDIIQELQEFDINDLDPENVGSWPTPVKAVVWMLVFIAALTLRTDFVPMKWVNI